MSATDASPSEDRSAVIDNTAKFIIENTKDLASGEYVVFQSEVRYMNDNRAFTMIVAKYHDGFDVVYWLNSWGTFVFRLSKEDLVFVSRVSRIMPTKLVCSHLQWELNDSVDKSVCKDWKDMSALAVIKDISCVQERIIIHREVPADYMNEFLVRQLTDVYCKPNRSLDKDTFGTVVMIEKGLMESHRLNFKRNTVLLSYFEGVGSIEQGRLYKILRRDNDDPRRI
jgi:hypothetical protein